MNQQKIPCPPNRPPHREAKKMLFYLVLFLVVFYPVTAALTAFWFLKKFPQEGMMISNVHDLIDSVMIIVPFCLKSWGASFAGDGGYLMTLRMVAIIQVVFPGVIAFALSLYLTSEISHEKYICGRTLSDDPDQASRDLAESRNRYGGGIYIHPLVQISLDNETKHFACVGSTGAGKTTVIKQVIREILTISSIRLLLFDFKPEYMATIPGDVTIISPTDQRGPGWDVANDIRDGGHAHNFATSIIPESKEPFFSNGARLILQAAIMLCQHQKPMKWTLSDVVEIFKTESSIQSAVKKYLPTAFSLVEDLTSTSTKNLLGNLSAHLGIIFPLANQWEGRKKVSIRRWLAQEGAEANIRVLILGGNKEYESLEMAYMKTVLSITGGIICGPSFPDSKKRQVWIVIDEAPQLEKQDILITLLEIGRSKGIRVVLGFQDIAQIRELYTVHGAQILESLIGTWIICQVKGSVSPKWASDMLGKQDVYRYSETVQRQNGSMAKTTSGGWQRAERPVIRPDELTDDLGPVEGGIKAILYIAGLKSIYLLTWPFAQDKEYRPLYVPQQMHMQPCTKKEAVAIGKMHFNQPIPASDDELTPEIQNQQQLASSAIEDVITTVSQSVDPLQSIIDELDPEDFDGLFNEKHAPKKNSTRLR